MKNVIVKLTTALTALVVVFSLMSCGTSYYGTSENSYYENYYDYNPAWAPDYYLGTRYYYFPDIETYYDLATRNFVYLYNGHWLFVPALPPIYSTFNLHNAFIVIVNRSVHTPWMHHHYYNSHYPRYYYIDYYDFSNIPYVRGYNENGRRAVYWREAERNRAREWGDRSIREGRKFKYSTDDRRVQQEVTRRTSQRVTVSPSDLNRIGNADEGRMTSRDSYQTTSRTSTTTTHQTATTPQRSTSTRRSEETNYYGGEIGQPVKVQPQMRESSSGRTSSSRNDGTSTQNRETTTSGRSSGSRR